MEDQTGILATLTKDFDLKARKRDKRNWIIRSFLLVLYNFSPISDDFLHLLQFYLQCPSQIPHQIQPISGMGIFLDPHFTGQKLIPKCTKKSIKINHACHLFLSCLIKICFFCVDYFPAACMYTCFVHMKYTVTHYWI